MAVETTADRFTEDVIKASHKTPVLVDFWAPWCNPCRVLGPLLDKLEAEDAGRWKLVKVNTDEEQALAAEYRIQGIPAVKLFRDGQLAGEFTGALPESAIKKFLDDHAPSAAGVKLDAAKNARSAGDHKMARLMLGEIVKEDPENSEARIELAELALAGDAKKARALLEPVADDGRFTDRIEAITTLTELQDALKRGDKTEAWKLYHQGIKAFTNDKTEQAIVHWIDAVKLSRNLDDGRLRQACVALFRWLGDEHEITQTYRRQFASALY